MYILGVSSYHPDASAALIADGKLLAACEEERFRRVKHFAGFPAQSIEYCLREAGISLQDIDYVAVPRKRSARMLKKLYYGAKIPTSRIFIYLFWEVTLYKRWRLLFLYQRSMMLYYSPQMRSAILPLPYGDLAEEIK